MAEKLNEQSISSIQNSHAIKKHFDWFNTLPLVSTMVHYCIMKEYEQLSWILQMREPNRHSSVAPFLASTLTRPSTLHTSNGSLTATW